MSNPVDAHDEPEAGAPQEPAPIQALITASGLGVDGEHRSRQSFGHLAELIVFVSRR